MTRKGKPEAESYSAAAARRSFEALMQMRESEARARQDARQRAEVDEEKRRVARVEHEFVDASNATERMELLVRAAKAEFDRACGYSRRLTRAHGGVTSPVVVHLVERAFRFLDPLYVRRDAGGTLVGLEWHEAYAELASIRKKSSDAEARMRAK